VNDTGFFEVHSQSWQSEQSLFPKVRRSRRTKLLRRFNAERSSIGCFEVNLSRLLLGQKESREALHRDDLDLGEWEVNSV